MSAPSACDLPSAGRPDPKRREPLWDRVDANRFRLVAYLVLFALASSVLLAAALAYTGGALVFLVGYVGRSLNGAVWLYRVLFSGGLVRLWLIGLALGVAYEVWALLRTERWVLKRLSATLVPTGELLDAKFALKDMAIAAGLPVAPALYILPDSSVNAFVFRARGRRPVVGITRGFLKKLSTAEQRAVFANLVSRVITGDTLVSSALTSLLAPLNLYREHRIKRLDAEDRFLASAAESRRRGEQSDYSGGGDAYVVIAVLLPLVIAGIVVGEIMGAAQRKSQRTAGEKADAEGMLLLKDPAAMISAVEKCVVENNFVAAAGESLGDVFYFWTGLSTDDENDPEWQRVARLREILGVDGWVPETVDATVVESVFPKAPRIEE